jgi:hypothetical protein
MRARDKYISVFGKIETLAEPITWPTGISNMLEWLLWSTNDVLGVTKTRYREKIVDWSHDDAIRDSGLEEKQQFVIDRINEEMAVSERLNRYDRPTSSIASPREALRRAKYFSEDYLNKEFDIFWGLVSDNYLDSFYGQFTSLNRGGRWFTHGNSGLFACSTDIKAMQMDNLSYNPMANILIANELKLGGKKNPDQILKYALMYRLLVERNFISPNTRFLLLFIGDKHENSQWDDVLKKELEYCQKSTKSTLREALHPEGLQVAENAEFVTTTWSELMAFNDGYMSSLDLPSQQVEQKLLWGFNETLSAKAFMKSI